MAAPTAVVQPTSQSTWAHMKSDFSMSHTEQNTAQLRVLLVHCTTYCMASSIWQLRILLMHTEFTHTAQATSTKLRNSS